MCGIIAVVRRSTDRQPPTAGEIIEPLAAAGRDLDAIDPTVDDPVALAAIAAQVAVVDRRLRGAAGVAALVADPVLLTEVTHLARGLADRVAAIDDELDSIEADARLLDDGQGIETLNAVLIDLKDAVWAIEHDRIRTALDVRALAGPDAPASAVTAYLSIQQALSALDRLEVRGRDSAGLHLIVREHGLDLASGAVAAEIRRRGDDPLFTTGTVHVAGGTLGFVYKAAAEIGELGDNTRALRRAIAADDLLRRSLQAPTAAAAVLGHTRWASVGIISQPNAHPLNSDELVDEAPRAGSPDRDRPYVTAVLNGDVDNFADLKAAEALRIPTEITTDAKVIPTLVARELEQGTSLVEAFRRCVDQLEGSVAIGASVAGDPNDVLLALRGSGQALYVGLADDAFIVASEPYGLVEETDCYLRLDGETPADPSNPNATRGQIVRLRGEAAGTLEGIERLSYDGTLLPVGDGELVTAQITTRDIDRGDAPHFLLKEITEAPASFRKTLRGKLLDVDGQLQVVLGDATLPPDLRDDLASGACAR